MISHWILAARIKTLPVSICPVLLAVSLSLSHPSYSTITTICIVLCVLFIQIGTNFANDYFDFIKGADTNERVGPKRMTQSGRISPNVMKNATIVVFTLLLLGLYLVYVGVGRSYWLAYCLSSLVLFIQPPISLAYIGGAEVVSYLFFGPVSVIGTYYLQTLTWNFDLFIIGSGIGLITSALLVVNNTRDIDSDKKVNKKHGLCDLVGPFLYWVHCIFVCPYFSAWLPDNWFSRANGYGLILVFLAMLLTRRYGKSPADFNKLLALRVVIYFIYINCFVFIVI